MKRTFVTQLLILLLLAGCGRQEAEPTPAAISAAVEQSVTATVVPPVPSATPAPSATPVPSVTPAPTATATPAPTPLPDARALLDWAGEVMMNAASMHVVGEMRASTDDETLEMLTEYDFQTPGDSAGLLKLGAYGEDVTIDFVRIGAYFYVHSPFSDAWELSIETAPAQYGTLGSDSVMHNLSSMLEFLQEEVWLGTALIDGHESHHVNGQSIGLDTLFLADEGEAFNSVDVWIDVETGHVRQYVTIYLDNLTGSSLETSLHFSAFDEPLAITAPSLAPQPVTAIAASAHGRSVATSNETDLIEMWDSADGQPAYFLGRTNGILGLTFSPAGDMLAANDSSGLYYVWQTAEPAGFGWPVGDASADWVRQLAFSPDGDMLAAGTESGRVVVRRPVATYPIRREYGAHESPVRGLAFTPDGAMLVSAGEDGLILAYDMFAQVPTKTEIGREPGAITALAMHPYGSQVATLTNAGVALRPVVENAPVSLRLPCPQAPAAREQGVALLAFSPNGVFLACAGAEGVLLWAAGDFEAEPVLLNEHTEMVTALAFGDEGRRLYTLDAAGTLITWELQVGEFVPISRQPE